jgi:hypothetical protein
MSHLRLFLFSLLMVLICIAALIGHALLMQDWLIKPYDEETALTSEEKQLLVRHLIEDLRGELTSRYDGTVNSPTQWMGPYLLRTDNILRQIN